MIYSRQQHLCLLHNTASSNSQNSCIILNYILYISLHSFSCISSTLHIPFKQMYLCTNIYICMFVYMKKRKDCSITIGVLNTYSHKYTKYTNTYKHIKT